MARRVKIRRTPPYRGTLTAAGQKITDPSKTFKSSIGGSGSDWQEQAWTFLDKVGELRYYVGWRASSVGRCRLVGSDIDPVTGRPTGFTDNTTVQQIVRDIAGGVSGQTQMLKRLATALTVPGEGYVAMLIRDSNSHDTYSDGSPLSAEDRAQLDFQEWVVLSRDEIKKSGAEGLEFTLQDGTKHEYNPDQDLLFRVWNPHPRKASEADSPVRAAEDALMEIVRTTKSIDNAAKSRLVGNGIVFIPQEMSLPDQNAPGATPMTGDAPAPIDPTYAAPSASQQLQELLYQVGTTAYKDQESMAAFLPIIASVPGEWTDKVKHVTFDSAVAETSLKTREAAIRRLAMSLDVAPEQLLGLGSSNHWCVDDQTEILTQRGWLTESELQIGDIALTLNHTTGLSEWQLVRDVYRAPVVDETMLSMETRTHSSLTTMGHRWAVERRHTTRGTTTREREFVLSSELRSSDRIPSAAISADLPDTAKYTDEIVELAAWYWTEGNDGASVTIAQSHTRNPDRVARIRACLTRMYGPATEERMQRGAPQWRETVQPNHSSFGGPITVFRLNKAASVPLHEIAPGKIMSTDAVQNMTPAQLELFIDVSAQGDGQHYRSGQLDMWQKDERAIEAYELALILSGRMTQRQQIDGGHRVGVWRQNAVQPIKAAQNSGTAAEVRHVEYTGTVWCPVTENGTWFARRNGKSFYTGNSAWALAEDDVKVHVVPVLETIVESLTRFVLRPMLENAGVDPDHFVIWYDTTPLTQDPDKKAEAQSAHDRGAITSKALREYSGFGDEDAYDLTTAEGWQQLARDKAAADVNLIPTLAPLLGAAVANVQAPAQQPAIEPTTTTPTVDDPDTLPESEPVQQPDSTDEPEAVTSSVSIALVDTFVARALELANKRRRNRANAHAFRDIPVHLAHRNLPKLPVEEVPKLIEGWDTSVPWPTVERLGFTRATVTAWVEADVYDALSGI